MPYKFDPSALQLEAESELATESGDVDLRQSDQTAHTVKIRVTHDEDLFDRVLPSTADSIADVAGVISVFGISSRVRDLIKLDRTSDTEWAGEVSVDRSEGFGEIELRPFLVFKGSSTKPGYAAHPGDRVAEGNPIKLILDDPPITLSSHISIDFADFAESNNRELYSNADLTHVVAFSEFDAPKIWLNSHIDEFKSVLSSTGPRGGNARIRDALFATVTAHSWSTISSVGLGQFATALWEAPDEPDLDVFDELPEWVQQVAWLAMGNLGMGNTANSVELLAQAIRGGELPELFQRLQTAHLRSARPTFAFEGLIRLRDSDRY